MLDYRIPLELTKYLASKERNYIPWLSFFSSLPALVHVIGRTQYNGIFQQYIISIIKPLYDELGTSEKPGESQNDKLLRSFIIKIACSNNYEPCLEWAKQKYQEWMASPEPDKVNPIPFDFRETVQCSAIKAGGQKEWEFLWQRTLYPLISPVNLKLAYLTLGCTREPWLINSYLEKSLDGSIAIQNIQYIWKSIAHPVGLNVGFEFLRTDWDRIYDSYQHIFGNIKSIFEDFLSKLSTKTDLEDLTVFYRNHKENLYPVSSLILSVVDRLKWRIYWTQSHMETIVTWLLQNITK
ncbi:hypothetical protein ILUMI_06967 [Ignelater luminosus]|uniref:ERAP1-like C-terminal domain-containing protein n=1 Tax=Ignelater luminosus TaxID=2038154 RepID=A0A8K0D9M9_IGNLU|nr:hypothetical protein ILUMI_06967 [Ignelater luminosus]